MMSVKWSQGSVSKWRFEKLNNIRQLFFLYLQFSAAIVEN